MRKLLVLSAALLLAVSQQASAALVAGDIAIVGRINNGSPDSFSFAPLVDLAAGEVIYFTDNGWTGTQYRGASATDGDGNENLTKFTVNSAIAAGTLVVSSATSTSYTFTTSGSIPGTTSGAFASLALGQGGEQIYAFSGPTNNPLLNPTTNLFVLDDTNGFENATDSSTGNASPGLTTGSTALTFSPSPLAGMFRLIDDGATRDRGGWLTYISTSSNWTASASGSLAETTNLAFAAIPEPSAYLFGGIATLLTGAGLYRRRFLS